MHNMIFEDSLHPSRLIDGKVVEDVDKYIVLSKMIQDYVNSDNIEVLFSKSANNIERVIESTKSDRIIVYYDLVYDNSKTVKKLITLLSYLLESNIHNVAVVPIHCIEWHCIKCFGKESNLKNIVVNLLDYTDTDIYRYNMNKSKSTNEKFCKAVMGELVDKKFHSSCSVSEYKISKDEEKTLVYSLPIFFSNDKGLNYVNASKFLEEYYNSFVRLLKCDIEDKNLLESTLSIYLKKLNF